jgi:transposase
MNRGDVTNRPGERLQPRLPPPNPTSGRPAHEHRTLRQGLLWRLRTGAPWRDWPERDGPWRTVASRFSRWQRAGVLPHLVAPLPPQAEAAGPWEWPMHVVDRPIIRAPQQAAGATTGPRDRRLRAQPRRLSYQPPAPGRGPGPAHDLHPHAWAAS